MTLRRRILCLLGIHAWEKHQTLLCTSEGCEMHTDTVIAWRQCQHCAKSRLVHILK